MIWLIAMLVIGLVYIAEVFRSQAVYWKQEANWWRNEAEKQAKKEEAFEGWMPTGGRHPLDWN